MFFHGFRTTRCTLHRQLCKWLIQIAFINVSAKTSSGSPAVHSGLFTKLQKQHTIEDNNWELVPPDGGWGWLVLAGSMLVNVLVPGTVKSFGVLFIEFLEAFDASPSAALWIPAICYFLYSSLGEFSKFTVLYKTYMNEWEWNREFYIWLKKLTKV